MVSLVSSTGNPVTVARVQVIWAGSGTTNAPASAMMGTIGANQGGIQSAEVYHYTGSAWVDTGATVINLYGGTVELP
jgi:hypothetical protein